MRKIEVKGTIVGNADKWIYEWFGMDATCPKDVNAAISEANGEPLLVEINSGGGDVFAGSEIYTALKAYAGTVEINIVGLAASAASVIAQAGHSRISPTALFMVHNVSGSAAGDFHDMQQEAEILQQIKQSRRHIWKRQAKAWRSCLASWMRKRGWMRRRRWNMALWMRLCLHLRRR